MTVAYDGSGFHGFASQPGLATVGGALEGAVSKVLGCQLQLTCAGRTDAGVHAWGQVVHLDVPVPASGQLVAPEEIASACNRMLAPAIVVRSSALAPPDFDARRSARYRSYRYTVLNRTVPDPFLVRYSWHVVAPLDLRAMMAATDPLIGAHDFSAFCRRVDGTPPGEEIRRRVLDARWVELDEGLLRFEISASSYCHQMVRSVVGTLVEVGRGRRKAGEMAWILRSRDRSKAGSPAPPHGLCLWEVGYDE